MQQIISNAVQIGHGNYQDKAAQIHANASTFPVT
jgi:hypothetical protein